MLSNISSASTHYFIAIIRSFKGAHKTAIIYIRTHLQVLWPLVELCRLVVRCTM